MPSSAEDWIASLSPWPEEFGLGRMHELLARLGDPQRAYPAVHIVGTNGKSTATRRIAALLRAEGLRAGAYTSPHVSGWGERLDTDPAGFERAVARIRPDAEAVGATQFEALTAAALAEFAERGVDVAVVEAGLGGRLDATNVLDSRVVHLTNVGLEHTEVLGETREEIAREKLAVAKPGAVVVLGEEEWAPLVSGNRVVVGGAREAAEAFLGRPVEAEEVAVSLPGRLEWRSARELWDGAHNADGIAWLVERLPARSWVVVASILSDKDAEAMVRSLSPVASVLVVTESANPRALPADELARLAAPHFARIEALPEPAAARARAFELAGPDKSVLVTGSLYLLADLVRSEYVPCLSPVHG
jgi:dihydrofolate synthase/folylpolyglutamate synthase